MVGQGEEEKRGMEGAETLAPFTILEKLCRLCQQNLAGWVCCVLPPSWDSCTRKTKPKI